MKTECIFAAESGRAGTSVPKAGAGGSGDETCEEALTGPEVVGQETSMAPNVFGASNVLPMTSVSMTDWRARSVTGWTALPQASPVAHRYMSVATATDVKERFMSQRSV